MGGEHLHGASLLYLGFYSSLSFSYCYYCYCYFLLLLLLLLLYFGFFQLLNCSYLSLRVLLFPDSPLHPTEGVWGVSDQLRAYIWV